MTSIAINQFGGMMPRLGDQKIAGQFAQLAVNTELTSGDLVPHRAPVYVDSIDPGFEAAIAYRAQPDGGADVWKSFANRFAHFVKGPLTNDAYERYYWTEEGEVPRYSTRTRIAADQQAWILGVPAPTTAPAVAPSGGDPDLSVTRVYVYTFVTQYGEESAPSPPTVVIGNDDGTWDLSALETALPDPTERPTHTKRIYRTVSGQTGTTYFLVEEIALAATTYSDTSTTDEVALGTQLQSHSWNTPPTDMIGMVVHPNGFLIGFSERNLYFSEPYRPHAWPAEYTLSTISSIQALAVFGSSIGVPTLSFPYICHGSHPGAMSLIRQDSSEPCASRLGVVGTPHGVIYPSLNGLIMLGPAGIQRISKPIIERDTWITEYTPAEIEAAIYRAYYIGLFDDGTGFIFAFDNPNGLFSEVGDFLPDFDSVQTDPYNGQLTFVRDNELLEWDNPFAAPLNLFWKSKEMVTPKPVNMGYWRIDGDTFSGVIDPQGDIDRQTFNINRAAAGPLDTFDMYALNEVRDYDGTFANDPAVVPVNMAQIKQPLGGSPLLDPPAAPRSCRVTLFADRKQVYQATVYESGRYRFPTGYKADIFEVQFEGDAQINHFKMAETGKDLARV
jgi:hypothetical protein